MKTYLVTGGAGFIGSNFVLYMLNKYEDISSAAEKVEVSNTSISKVLRGERNSAAGFIWRKIDVSEECSECHGKGGFDSKTCQECHGSGTITSEQRTMFGNFLSNTTCPYCGRAESIHGVYSKSSGILSLVAVVYSITWNRLPHW